MLVTRQACLLQARYHQALLGFGSTGLQTQADCIRAMAAFHRLIAAATTTQCTRTRTFPWRNLAWATYTFTTAALPASQTNLQTALRPGPSDEHLRRQGSYTTTNVRLSAAHPVRLMPTTVVHFTNFPSVAPLSHDSSQATPHCLRHPLTHLDTAHSVHHSASRASPAAPPAMLLVAFHPA